MRGSSCDATSRNALSKEAQDDRSSDLQRQLCDSLFDGVYFVDDERRITYWNGGAESLTGFSKADAVGRHCHDNFLSHVDEFGHNLCNSGCPLSATLRDGKRRDVEAYLQHKEGHRLPVSIRVSPVMDSAGGIVGAVEIFSDISGQKRLERRAQELESIANSDPLTGIPNRRHINIKVRQEMLAVEEFGRTSGLILIDVDLFKKVNDEFGHLAGDAVLKAIAATLTRTVRPGDSLGRWGGEEFLIVAANVDSKGLETAADRYRQLIAKSSIVMNGRRIGVTVSIGASLLEPGGTPDAAFAKVDSLMYQSKSLGRNRTTIG